MTQSDTQSQHDEDLFVESPTEYTGDVTCEQPIEIYIGGASEQEVTYFCQQLSLFLETHHDDVFMRLHAALDVAVDDADDLAAEVQEPADVPDDCTYPVEIEVEDIGFDAAHEIVGTLVALTSEWSNEMVAADFREALRQATADQPRSIVRLVKNDGGRRAGLEWHTDTDADLESA